jgi:hypothetical protein
MCCYNTYRIYNYLLICYIQCKVHACRGLAVSAFTRPSAFRPNLQNTLIQDFWEFQELRVESVHDDLSWVDIMHAAVTLLYIFISPAEASWTKKNRVEEVPCSLVYYYWCHCRLTINFCLKWQLQKVQSRSKYYNAVTGRLGLFMHNDICLPRHSVSRNDTMPLA